MSTGVCSRCGRNGEMEYGADGLPYCNSCSFYALNRQCGRCRMYLPAAELQQYRGMWICPNCMMNAREEDQKREEPKEKYKKEDLKVQPLIYSEGCQRCGRDVELLYIFNGKRLCSSCLRSEQDKTKYVGGGPSATPYRITVEKKKQKGGLWNWLLTATGLKKKQKQEESTIVAVDNRQKTKKKKKKDDLTKKPLTEEKTKEPKRKRSENEPKSEGIAKEVKGRFDRFKKE